MQPSLEQLRTDPYPVLARLRVEQPVTRMDETGMWLVTRRADVIEVLRSPELYRTDSERSPILQTFGAQMLSTEGAQHHRYKRKCVPRFTLPAVNRHMRGRIGGTVAELIEGFAGEDCVDLRPRFAAPVAVRTVAYELGIDAIPPDRVLGWYDAFAAALANFTKDPAVASAGLAAAAEFGHALERVLHHSRSEDDGSLLPGLLREADDPLTWTEIRANAMIILFGGIETAESMILNALWALLTHPDQLRRVVADPGLLGNAIEESLRWEPAVQSCTRYAAVDTVLNGVRIRAGETVQCMIGAANRDPAHFEEPDRFDIDRPNARDHLTFGSGRHLCLGMSLARVEAEVAVGTLLRRFPDLSLDPSRPSAPVGYEFRKPPSLHVRC